MRGLSLASCVSLGALAWAIPAQAQTVTPPPGDPRAQGETAASAAGTPAGLPPPSGALSQAQQGDDIVVTASRGDRTRFKSSISVSQISNEAIQNFTPRSQAEILRSIPGIQTAANVGPGGNANIGVRGIPVSTGGSEYVALQEDGLPVTLFGDMNFGNNDYWLRFDYTVDRVEAVRGGSASTFASQAPGAVINFISRTGDKEGGTIGYTEGLDFRQHKLNFNYGGHLSETMRFNVGGYYVRGAGPADISYDVYHGYQIKANVTKDFPDDRGYVRILFKRLDEQAPTNTTTPAFAKLDGNEVVGFTPLPNFDPRQDSTYSKYTRRFQFVDQGGKLQTADVDGIHPVVTSIGAQLHYNLNDAITFDDNFRYTDMHGNFTTQFLNFQPVSNVIGSTVNGQVVGSIRYANGPDAGQTFTGSYVNNNPNIHTVMHDMGNLVNNLTLSGKLAVGPGTLSATAGWFHMRQKVEQTWMVNPQLSEIVQNGAELDLFSTTGQQISVGGQTGFNNNWGTCCARNVDVAYTDDAPFVSASYVWGGLNLDASARFDRVSGEGTAQAGGLGPNYTVTDQNGSAILPSYLPNATPIERVNYVKSYTSWSVGALYAFTNDTSLFVRASRGGRFNADRRLLAGSVALTPGVLGGVYSGGNFNADGSLNAQGNATTINFLNQQEVGLKQRGRLFGEASYTAELTLFHSSLTETNYDFTRINQPPPNNNPNISNRYRAYGVEFTGNVALGDFRISANMTYTSPKITGSATPALAGHRPGGIPRFQYFISPTYDHGFFAVGASIDGQSKTPLDDFNTYYLTGSVFVNAFLKIRPVHNLELGVNVNNLFDKLGYRNGGGLTNLGSQTVFSNTAIFGRTTEASIRYNF